jgi:NADPH2:quinone reductase
MASRQEPKPLAAARLMAHSTAVVGFWLMHALGRADLHTEPLRELLELVATGELTPQVGGTYPLGEARAAHEALRARRTTGKLVLDPRE